MRVLLISIMILSFTNSAYSLEQGFSYDKETFQIDYQCGMLDRNFQLVVYHTVASDKNGAYLRTESKNSKGDFAPAEIEYIENSQGEVLFTRYFNNDSGLSVLIRPSIMKIDGYQPIDLILGFVTLDVKDDLDQEYLGFVNYDYGKPFSNLVETIQYLLFYSDPDGEPVIIDKTNGQLAEIDDIKGELMCFQGEYDGRDMVVSNLIEVEE